MGNVLTVAISGTEINAGGLAARTRTPAGVKINVPERLRGEQVKIVKRDLELLLAALEKSPEGVNAVLAAGASGDYAAALKAAEEHQLTEAAFVSQGGGLWVAVAVGLAILLYSEYAY